MTRATHDRLARLRDLTVSLVALVVLLPVLAAIALVVLVTLGRPVLFRQVRPGRDGRPFTLLKFRTMLDVDSPVGVPVPDAARLTPTGAWLRSTSLDELPELINVAFGDMSLVGPRPLLVEYLDLYTPEQARRHEVRPGMTGWAQVNGRNAPDWNERLAMDVWYVDHRSPWLDLRILARTVAIVLRRDGIARAGHATVPRFTGSGTEAAS